MYNGNLDITGARSGRTSTSANSFAWAPSSFLHISYPWHWHRLEKPGQHIRKQGRRVKSHSRWPGELDNLALNPFPSDNVALNILPLCTLNSLNSLTPPLLSIWTEKKMPQSSMPGAKQWRLREIIYYVIMDAAYSNNGIANTTHHAGLCHDRDI